MSKRHGVFTENFTIFFKNAGKTENVSELEFERFYVYIVTTSTFARISCLG